MSWRLRLLLSSPRLRALLRRDLLAELVLNVRQDDARPFGREQARGLLTRAPRRTRHDRDLAFDAPSSLTRSHCRFPLLRLGSSMPCTTDRSARTGRQACFRLQLAVREP